MFKWDFNPDSVLQKSAKKQHKTTIMARLAEMAETLAVIFFEEPDQNDL